MSEYKSPAQLYGMISELLQSLKENMTTTPFASKVLPNGKKLYTRARGDSKAMSAGSNTHEFTITYTHAKFTEIEVIGGEVGDTISLEILDDASGTYSTVPNAVLNQFGYSVAVAPDLYKRGSNYDADLYTGMRIKITYDSASAKTVYFNYILHEVV